MSDDVVRFFTTKFMVHQQLTEDFPSSEKSLNRHYPPPKQITSENYLKSEKHSRAIEQGQYVMNQETQESYRPDGSKPKEFAETEHQLYRQTIQNSQFWSLQAIEALV
uniref:Uncharacterized protein n=1 Tax=Coccidioides posadasii RMSCC 3488 TaxID=454284 RepID=A0A0J6FIP2_COCPO|nr:hypothetical protein CPAG_05028 [Coccidioides posadasii RMSCC 3488]